MLRGRILVKLSISSLGVPVGRVMFHMCSIYCPFRIGGEMGWPNCWPRKFRLTGQKIEPTSRSISARPQSSCKAFFEGGRLTIWRSHKMVIIRNHSNKMRFNPLRLRRVFYLSIFQLLKSKATTLGWTVFRWILCQLLFMTSIFGELNPSHHHQPLMLKMAWTWFGPGYVF